MICPFFFMLYFNLKGSFKKYLPLWKKKKEKKSQTTKVGAFGTKPSVLSSFLGQMPALPLIRM